jgi:hypothetical protein
MNNQHVVTDISMEFVNRMDDYIDLIQDKLVNRNKKQKVKIKGDDLVIVGKNNIEGDDSVEFSNTYSEYSITLLLYSEYDSSTVLQNEVKSVCGDSMIHLLNQSLKEFSSLILLRKNSELIGICCFVNRSNHFGIQSMFVTSENRRSGFGGCFLSLLQDFSIIVNDKHDCILPIFMMQIKDNGNKDLLNFYAKYFLVKPTNNEDILLVEKVSMKPSLIGIKYYMILRIPLLYVLKDIFPQRFSNNWKSVIDVSKITTSPAEHVLTTSKKYTDVERMFNVLFFGNDKYNNWLNKDDYTKWVWCHFKKHKDKDTIGQLELCKKLFMLDNVGASPIIFNDLNNDDVNLDMASYLGRLICKNEKDVQRMRTFLSFTCLLISQCMSTNDFLFREDFFGNYEKYFSRKIKSLKKTFGVKTMQFYFNKMYTSFLKYDNWLGFDEYCFIANCFDYDVVLLTPTCKKSHANEPVFYKNKDYYLWCSEKKVFRGTLVNNDRAVVFLKSSNKRYILSYLNLNMKLDTSKKALATYSNNVKFRIILEKLFKKSQKDSVVLTKASIPIESEEIDLIHLNTDNPNNEIYSMTEQFQDALDVTTETIQTGKFVYDKKDGNGFLLPLPYFVAYMLQYGVELPISIINSFLNFIKDSPERNINDHFFVINMESINYINPLAHSLMKTARNIYVVCNEDLHYHLYEFNIIHNMINIYDCTDSNEKCCDYIGNAFKIISTLMQIKAKQKVARTAEDIKKKNYWLFKSFHPYTVFQNDCACCVIMQILERIGLYCFNKKIIRRRYFISKYLRLFSDIKVENLTVSDTIYETSNAILEMKRFGSIMSNNLDDDKKAKQIVLNNIQCYLCKTKIVPYELNNSDECELTKKSIGMSVDDCIKDEFTIHELHCDCFKLYHKKCYPASLLGSMCKDCGVCYRAEYCYVCGDLEYVKENQEESKAVDEDSIVELCTSNVEMREHPDQYEDGEIIENRFKDTLEFEQVYNSTDLQHVQHVNDDKDMTSNRLDDMQQTVGKTIEEHTDKDDVDQILQVQMTNDMDIREHPE